MQTLSQYRGSNNDQHMGANELESSPEVRSHYLQPESRLNGDRTSEPKTVSRNPSQPGIDGDRTSSQHHQSASANRPQHIDQSSIIKNQDESAFTNNLNIFPSANASQVPANAH